jgi:hypothetical protein
MNGYVLTAQSPARGLGRPPPVSVPVDLAGHLRPASGADTGADQF